jgi:gamma-glutamyltranspeptidase/glutathione hydrolase
LGQIQAAEAGNAVLAAGGNAVDAIATAALVAGVVAVPLTGIAGYGGHLIIAGLPQNKVTCIDFNGIAPASLKADYYKANAKGEVPGDINTYGWKSVGVPGVLAGVQLALDRYGSKKFPDVVEPAIRFAREGFSVSKSLATSIKSAQPRLSRDPGSAKFMFPNGEPLAEGATLKNLDLAQMLEELAKAGNVRPFYQGKIAERIAAAFKANDGLVTAADLAGFKAVEVAPLTLNWNGFSIHTPPPTSGGLTYLQALAALKALNWTGQSDPRIWIEALRIAWTDRFKYLGDPSQVEVPIAKLLSDEYAKRSAERIREALRSKKAVDGGTDGRPAGGTIHLNAIDKNGMTAAMTLTHGGLFGSQVTLDGLGLVLGHGLSRFDPRPGLANSPGPGKKPLHNMCPTIVVQNQQPILAVGATGGRRIVNAVGNVVLQRVGNRTTLAEAVKAPRVHTEGDLALVLDADYPEPAELKKLGYTITTASVASLNAIEREVNTGALTSAAR